MENVTTVLFDMDGVLIDSLSPHLQICADKSLEYGLDLSIPTCADFKKMVRRGVKISPMKFFFEAVGFPSDFADLATVEYNEIFSRHYAPKPFLNTGTMLSRLSTAKLTLGMVTSNIRANVVAALGSNLEFFHLDAIAARDDMGSDSKAEAIRTVAKRLNVNTSEIIYVGDQPGDWLAAKEAGTKFLGVSYGWGISEDDREFPVVNHVMAIAEFILG